MYDSVVYPSRPNPTTPTQADKPAAKDHSLAANLSKWMPAKQPLRDSMRAAYAEFLAEQAAAKVEAA